jgi:TonB-dependent siderophore receptor
MGGKYIRVLAAGLCLFMLAPELVWAAEAGAPRDDTILKEVVVTAVPLDKYLVTTSVITAKDIEAKGAHTVAEALRDVPGLFLHRGKKNANQVEIRGSSLTYAKIYVDGIFVNPFSKASGSDAVDLDMFPTGSIAKIEVIKGPAPVAYGMDAIGGIILITTKNGNEFKGGNLSVYGGSFGTLNGSAYYGGGDSKFNYYVTAGAENSDGFVTNAFRNSKSFRTKLNWQNGDKESFTFIGGYSLTDKGCLNASDPVTGEFRNNTSGFWPGLPNWQFKDWEKVDLSLDYARKVNDKLDYTLKVYRHTENQDLWADGRGYIATPGVVLVGGVFRNASRGYSTLRWNASYWKASINGVELQSNWKVSAAHTLTYGVTYSDLDWRSSASLSANDPYNPDSYRWDLYNNKRYGYYLQDNILMGEKVTVTLGVRHDRNELKYNNGQNQKGSATVPSANFVYRLDDSNTMRVSYGETFSFPKISEIFSTTTNLDLKPEKAKNYELGFKHKFDATLTGDIAIFQNDITDKIARDPADNTRYININRAKIKGAELELNKKFSARWDGFLNYTRLITASIDNNGAVTELQNNPRNMINYGVTYHADKGYEMSLVGHWVSNRFTNDPLYSQLPSYHVVDFRIKRIINEKYDWYVSAYNIFNKQYQDELYYYAPGRSVMVGVNCKF